MYECFTYTHSLKASAPRKPYYVKAFLRRGTLNVCGIPDKMFTIEDTAFLVVPELAPQTRR